MPCDLGCELKLSSPRSFSSTFSVHGDSGFKFVHDSECDSRVFGVNFFSTNTMCLFTMPAFSVGTVLSDIQQNHFLITFAMSSSSWGIAVTGVIDFKVKEKNQGSASLIETMGYIPSIMIFSDCSALVNNTHSHEAYMLGSLAPTGNTHSSPHGIQ